MKETRREFTAISQDFVQLCYVFLANDIEGFGSVGYRVFKMLPRLNNAGINTV